MTAEAAANAGFGCDVGGKGAPGVSTLIRPEAELDMQVEPVPEPAMMSLGARSSWAVGGKPLSEIRCLAPTPGGAWFRPGPTSS